MTIKGKKIGPTKLTALLLSLILVAGFYFAFDSRGALSDRNLVIGEPVAEGIIAVHQFSAPYSSEEIDLMTQEAEASIPIYLKWDEETGNHSSEQIMELVLEATDDNALARYFKQRVQGLYSTGIIDIEVLRLTSTGSRTVINNNPQERNVSELFTLNEARNDIRLDLERRAEREEFPGESISGILDIIVSDLTVDSAARGVAVQEKISDLPVVKRVFHTGEEILPPGGLYTEEISRYWEAMVLSPEGNQGVHQHNYAKTALAAMLLLLGFYYIWKEQKSFAFTISDTLLLFTIWALSLGLTALLVRSEIRELSMFSFTMLGAGLTSVFFDGRLRRKAVNYSWFLAAVFSAMIALTSPYPMAAFFMGFVPACLVSASVRDLSDKGTSTALLLGVLSSVLVYWLLAAAGSSGSMKFNIIVWLALVGLPLVITGILRVIIHPLEILFGVSTALTYRRLGNDSYPLREQLHKEARGTYIHSRLVADLASDAALELGMDEELAQLGGIFHDIGKLTNPGMFIENISNPDENNPHINMSPAESAKVILAHVSDGVVMARKHHLPSELIDIIEQHHGDTSARFFLEKARRELPPGGELDETIFHYNGPRPQTVEAALVMLADSVSSAVKGLGKDASFDEKAAAISRIIQEKSDEGQFDQCKFTGPMQTRVAHVFMDVLNREDYERVKDYPHGNK